MNNPIKDLYLLLVEDNLGDVRLIQEMLQGNPTLHLTSVDCLSTALENLEQKKPDVILLDMGLPDSKGLNTVTQVVKRKPLLPVVVVTGHDDDLLALNALKIGAQDYLVKDKIDADTLVRSVRYALERKRAEEALNESERLLNEALSMGKMGIWSFDLSSNQITWTKQVFEIYGRDPSLGPPSVDEEAAYYEPEVAEMLQGYASKASETGESFTYDIQARREDGSIVQLYATMHPMKDITGKVVKLIGIVQDITSRKMMEKELIRSETFNRSLLEHLPQRIFLKDRNSVYVSCNRNFARDLGIEQEQIKGKKDYNFFPRELADKYRADDQTVMNNGESKEVEERYLIGSEERWVHTIKVPFRDEQGCIVGVLGIFQDITERKQAEAEKEKLQTQFLQAQKMEAIGQLAGGTAHDFNNLLTVIGGNASLALIHLNEADPFYKYLEQIQKATRRAANLTQQLLAFSRKQILEPKVVNLNTIVGDIEKMLKRLLREDIEYTTIIAPDLWNVKVDVGQMEQIIVNLVVNAKDAMPNGGKLIIETANRELGEEYVRSYPYVKPGLYVMLALSDTGCGMTPEVMGKIFEPFFTTKEKGQGTGLGLPTVYGIVKQSGGNINVYSEPGKGTAFKLYFPRVEAPAEAVVKKETKAQLPKGTETILVVEDNEALRELTSRILQNLGYEVVSAANGEEAFLVYQTKKKKVDLVLTDIILPKMSGAELATLFKDFCPQAKTIFMSGYTEYSVLQNDILKQGIPFLSKPFEPMILAQKVREVLDGK